MPKIRNLIDHNKDELVRILNEAVSKKELITIICKCSIDYHGRSRSILPEGDRLIIIKTNGSVLVHRPKGYSPVNWQPETSSIMFSVENNEIIMKAIRDSPRETLVARFSSIYGVTIAEGLIDDSRFIMYATEKEIKDIIESNPAIIEEGLEITSREERTSDGIIDFVGKDAEGRIVIIEVKDERAGIDSGKQLLRYVLTYKKKGVDVRGLLVAPSFSRSVIEFLERNGLEKKRLNIEKIIEAIEKKKIMNEERKKTLLEYV